MTTLRDGRLPNGSWRAPAPEPAIAVGDSPTMTAIPPTRHHHEPSSSSDGSDAAQDTSRRADDDRPRRPRIQQELPSCAPCGLPLGEGDDVVEVATRFLHVPCAESAHGPRSGWTHGDVRAWSEWAQGVGRAGGVTG